MKFVAWLIRLLVFLLLLLFALQNQHSITLHGLFGSQATWPLAWVMALMLALGAALGVLAMLPRVLRRKPKPAVAHTSPQTSTRFDVSDELGV